jgi:hypothetical protein
MTTRAIWKSASRKILLRSFTYAPVLRALAALGPGKPADAVERLENRSPI